MKWVYGFKVSGIILPDGWQYVLGPTWWQSKWFNACVFITQHKIVIRVRFICSLHPLASATLVAKSSIDAAFLSLMESIAVLIWVCEVGFSGRLAGDKTK